MMPGQHAEHARFGAARDETRRRRLGVQTPVTRAVLDREHGRLPFEPEDAAPRVRLSRHHAGVVDEVSRGEVVGAVENDVVARDELQRVRGVERHLVRLDVHVGIQPAEPCSGHLELRPADVADRNRAPAAEGSSRRRCRNPPGRSCRRRRPRGTSPRAIPSPPAPTHSTRAALSRRCPSRPTSSSVKWRLKRISSSRDSSGSMRPQQDFIIQVLRLAGPFA